MIAQTLWRAMPAALLLLAGCSALQIDVDVYTGKLDGNPDLQIQHYTALAVAARPMLESISRANQSLASTDADWPYREALKSSLCHALLVFEGDSDGKLDVIAFRARTKCADEDGVDPGGLGQHYKDLQACLAGQSRSTDCQVAMKSLDRTIVELADRLLLGANTVQLRLQQGRDRDDKGPSETVRNDLALIQSLGNTLLVHASDLMRQREHLARMNDKALVDADRGAQQRALDRIDRWLDRPSTAQAAASAPAAASAAIGKNAPASGAKSAKAAKVQSPPAPAAATPATEVHAPSGPNTVSEGDAARQMRLLSETTSLGRVLPKEVAAQLAESAGKGGGGPGVKLDGNNLPLWIERMSKNTAALTDDQRRQVREASNVLGVNAGGQVCLLQPGPGEEALACPRNQRLDMAERFISTLKLRKVELLATGRAADADLVQQAVNAAYDLRTSMMYLRPAGDYLRSVYTASAYQQATEYRYRNMLDDWSRYLNHWGERNGPFAEVDKLAWQNINRVNVSGGGNTNYVVAKDDVGNWYVKAYDAKPDPIIKAASSLALYNSGARLKTNLLARREDLRRMNDPTTSAEERQQLRDALREGDDTADATTLAKVQTQQRGRYQQESRGLATQLADAIDTLAAAARQAAASPAAPAPTGCKLPALAERTQGGARLDGLAAAQDSLRGAEKSLGNAMQVEATAGSSSTALRAKTREALEALESAHDKALLALSVYAESLPRAMKPDGEEGCSTDTRWSAGAAAQTAVRQPLVKLAAARRAAVNRYIERLEDLSDVAAAP